MIELEKKKLKYLGGLAKNRKVSLKNQEEFSKEIRLDNLAESLSEKDFTAIELKLEKPRTVFVTIKEVKLSQLEGIRTIAIVMNAANFSEATDIDYFITNIDRSIVTPQWVVTTYSQRNAL